MRTFFGEKLQIDPAISAKFGLFFARRRKNEPIFHFLRVCAWTSSSRGLILKLRKGRRVPDATRRNPNGGVGKVIHPDQHMANGVATPKSI